MGHGERGHVGGLRQCPCLPRENIETLALELNFWAENRTISVSSGERNYTLNRYYVPYGGPR